MPRKAITIDNTAGGALSDYQIEIEITYEAAMQTDFSDVRFRDSDEVSLLDFWLETYTASTTATFWVEVPAIPGASNYTIYVYYGDALAPGGSNGDDTFIFFDDFSGADGAVTMDPIPQFRLNDFKVGSGTDNRVLSLGAGGTWDDARILHPCAVDDGAGTVWLFYGGYDGATYQIGVASVASAGFDGTGFVKSGSNPILTVGGGGAWDDTHVAHPYVILDGATWKMWYAGYDGSVWKIGYATAADPEGPWTKHGSNPILAAEATWEGSHVLLPSVLIESTSPDFDTTSLVSWWGLGEASGLRLDSHGTNDLTPYNTPGNRTGKVHKAADLVFHATLPKYLAVADNASLQMGDIDFSIAGWLYADSSVTGNRFIIAKDDGTVPNREWRLDHNAGTLRFFVFGAAGAVVGQANWGSAISPDTWYFVVAWHDAGSNQVGISVNNAAPVTAATTGAPTVKAGVATTLGRFGTAFDGGVDEWLITKRLLSSDERTWLYNAGAGRSYIDILWDYKMLYTADDVSTSAEIGIAVSDDGIAWHKSGNSPALTTSGTSFMTTSVFSPRTFEESGGTYYMYLSGKKSSGGMSYSGWASTTDIEAWTANAYPILMPTRAWEFDDGTNGYGETENLFHVVIGSNDYIYYDAYYGITPSIGVIAIPSATANAPDLDLTKWDVGADGVYAMDNGELFHWGSFTSQLQTDATYSENTIVEVAMSVDYLATVTFHQYALYWDQATPRFGYMWINDAGNKWRLYYPGGSQQTLGSHKATVGTYRFKSWITAALTRLEYSGTVSGSAEVAGVYVPQNSKLYIDVPATVTTRNAYNFLFVRVYTSPEPSYGVGPEEGDRTPRAGVAIANGVMMI